MAHYKLTFAGGTKYDGPDEGDAKFEFRCALLQAIEGATQGLDDAVELYRDGRLIKSYRDGVTQEHEPA